MQSGTPTWLALGLRSSAGMMASDSAVRVVSSPAVRTFSHQILGWRRSGSEGVPAGRWGADWRTGGLADGLSGPSATPPNTGSDTIAAPAALRRSRRLGPG